MVSQVPIIGILMIVNGVLCILYGIVQMAMGPFMQSIFAMQGAQMPPEAKVQMQQMQQMMGWMVWVYIALGTLNAVAGLINIVGGIPAMRYRSRTFVIVALFTNVLTFASCYCLPTSLGLMIWGLIVMFQKDATEAFKMGTAGASVDPRSSLSGSPTTATATVLRRRTRRSAASQSRRRQDLRAVRRNVRGDGHDGIREIWSRVDSS